MAKPNSISKLPITKLSTRSLLLVISAAVIILGIGVALLGSGSHPTSAQRIANIESKVKCPSCDGVSSLDSNTAGAFAVRSFVGKEVQAGKSSSQIIGALESSYGPNILMSPPASNGGVVIAVLPFAFAVVVVGLIGFFGYRRRKKYGGSSDSVYLVPPVRDLGSSRSEETPEGAHLVSVDSAGAAESYEDENRSTSQLATAKGKNQFLHRKSWALYLGIILVLGGIGYGITVLRSQNNSQKLAASAVAQAKDEAQTILKARVLANQGQDVQALKLLSSVLRTDPNQPIALAYQGWLLRQAGEKDANPALINQGQRFLEQSVKVDPSYPDSRVFLGLILFQDRHDAKGAVAQFNAFLADNPSPSFIVATKSVIISAYQQAGMAVPTQLTK